MGKALAEPEERGLVKLVVDAHNGAILSGCVAAPAAAGKVILEVVAAMAVRATVRDLAEAIHVFPNFAEAIRAVARRRLADHLGSE